jgi:hypothetical protein
MMKSVSLESLTLVHPNAAGLDIGAREIWAAVRPDLDGEQVGLPLTSQPPRFLGFRRMDMPVVNIGHVVMVMLTLRVLM